MILASGRSPLLAIALLCVFAHPGKARATGGGAARLEDFFHWGVYDSLVSEGEKFLRDSLSQADSALQARIHLYLSVAYYKNDRIAESERSIVLSHRLDPRLTMDPFYTNSEIIEHYRLVLESYRSTLALRDSAGSRTAPPSRPVLAPSGLPVQAPAGKGKAGPILAASVLAVSAAAGGLAFYEYRRSEAAYRGFLHAARESGDAEAYRAGRAEVREADRWVLGSGLVSLLGLSGSVYLWHRYFRGAGGEGNPGLALSFDCGPARRVRLRVGF